MTEKNFRGMLIKISPLFNPMKGKRVNVESVLADTKDLPQVGSMIDIEGIIFESNPENRIVEEIYEMNYGYPKTPIQSTMVEVRRRLIRRGFFGLRKEQGSLFYDNISQRKYNPGDDGWQERYDFLQSRRRAA